MEISERKRAANRANAAKSTGPRTPEGKRRSSRNARRSRFLASSLLIDHESRDRFNNLLHSLNATYAPQDSVEQVLIEKMAAAHWRLLRIWAIETASLNHETRLQAVAVPNEPPPVQVMLAIHAMSDSHRHPDTFGRYERRYDREFYQAMTALTKYREEKMQKRSHQPRESKDPASENEPTSQPTPVAAEPTQGALQLVNRNSSTNALIPDTTLLP